ncbi:hypothetical protein PBI_ISOLDE_40 [Arthrobacter phage Isolde]|uniref:Uncharacterized protein n=1 Tax=Arthrobacter phage Isolde TaxID=2419610 RepID=A0A3G3M3K5_9CAUD|nr:hypothetical protein PP638_gp63 [Arthrobacter phage Isolde]AYR01009.1 hypothetical protein PBI_ISOLDE_40 [Arthrobacter phage Isolde]
MAGTKNTTTGTHLRAITIVPVRWTLDQHSRLQSSTRIESNEPLQILTALRSASA